MLGIQFSFRCNMGCSKSLYQVLSPIWSCNWIYPDRCLHLQCTTGFSGTPHRKVGTAYMVLWQDQVLSPMLLLRQECFAVLSEVKTRTLDSKWWKQIFTINNLTTSAEELALAWATWLMPMEQNCQRPQCKGHYICDSCQSKDCCIFLGEEVGYFFKSVEKQDW